MGRDGAMSRCSGAGREAAARHRPSTAFSWSATPELASSPADGSARAATEAESPRDRFHCCTPVVRPRRRNDGTERACGIAGCRAVSEKAGSHVSRVLQRHVPLGRIHVPGPGRLGSTLDRSFERGGSYRRPENGRGGLRTRHGERAAGGLRAGGRKVDTHGGCLSGMDRRSLRPVGSRMASGPSTDGPRDAAPLRETRHTFEPWSRLACQRARTIACGRPKLQPREGRGAGCSQARRALCSRTLVPPGGRALPRARARAVSSGIQGSTWDATVHSPTQGARHESRSRGMLVSVQTATRQGRNQQTVLAVFGRRAREQAHGRADGQAPVRHMSRRVTRREGTQRVRRRDTWAGDRLAEARQAPCDTLEHIRYGCLLRRLERAGKHTLGTGYAGATRRNYMVQRYATGHDATRRYATRHHITGQGRGRNCGTAGTRTFLRPFACSLEQTPKQDAPRRVRHAGGGIRGHRRLRLCRAFRCGRYALPNSMPANECSTPCLGGNKKARFGRSNDFLLDRRRDDPQPHAKSKIT
jgi:hypothetical protein